MGELLLRVDLEVLEEEWLLLFGGDLLCVEGPTAFPSSRCPATADELLELSSNGVITLSGNWDVKSDGNDPNYPFTRSTRTLSESDGFAKYKIQDSSTKQEFEMEIGSPFKREVVGKLRS